MTSLLERFVEGMRDAGRAVPDAPRAHAEVEQALATALEAGRVAWPSLALPPEVFARHLGHCLASQPPAIDVATALRECHAADLFIAGAAGNGVEEAVEILAGRYLDGVTGTVRKIDPGAEFLPEVMQILRHKLFVAAEGERPKILSFAGRAPLPVWLAAVAQTTALSLKRTDVARDNLKARAAAEAQVAALDPELRYLQAKYADRFGEAFRHALAHLSDRGRAILRLHSFMGMTLDQLAAAYGVNPATISRWFASARQDLLDETGRYMRDTFGVSPADLPSLARVLVSQVELSLSRLLDVSSNGGGSAPAE